MANSLIYVQTVQKFQGACQMALPNTATVKGKQTGGFQRPFKG
jgi:hypothetical protein